MQRQSRFEGLILDIRCPTPNSVCRCSAGGGGVAERWFQVLQSDKTRWCRESQLQLQATAVRPRGNEAHDCGVCFPGDDCGACVVCLDKRKFGGPGTMRRGCLVWREWSSAEAAAAAKAAAAAQVIVAAGGPVEMTAAAETTAATVAVPAAVPAAAAAAAAAAVAVAAADMVGAAGKAAAGKVVCPPTVPHRRCCGSAGPRGSFCQLRLGHLGGCTFGLDHDSEPTDPVPPLPRGRDRRPAQAYCAEPAPAPRVLAAAARAAAPPRKKPLATVPGADGPVGAQAGVKAEVAATAGEAAAAAQLDCGRCAACLDKRKFGGRGTKRKGCLCLAGGSEEPKAAKRRRQPSASPPAEAERATAPRLQSEWLDEERTLCVRSCSWSLVESYLRGVRDRAMDDVDEHEEFNIDYIIRQLHGMRDGPGHREAHTLLQLHRHCPERRCPELAALPHRARVPVPIAGRACAVAGKQQAAPAPAREAAACEQELGSGLGSDRPCSPTMGEGTVVFNWEDMLSRGAVRTNKPAEPMASAEAARPAGPTSSSSSSSEPDESSEPADSASSISSPGGTVGAPLAPEVLGVTVATLRQSRRCATVEFRAVYLSPQLRRRQLARAMVHFALREAREQCLRHRCGHCGRPLWAAAQLDTMQARRERGRARREERGSEGKRGEERGSERERERGHRTHTRTNAHTHTHTHTHTHAHTRMTPLLPPIYQAWVVLPHCMQTSAGFWARVGFELGAEVDRKEAKMAVLRSVGSLKGDVDTWSHSLTGPDGSPAAQLEGEGTLCKCVHER